MTRAGVVRAIECGWPRLRVTTNRSSGSCAGRRSSSPISPRAFNDLRPVAYQTVARESSRVVPREQAARRGGSHSGSDALGMLPNERPTSGTCQDDEAMRRPCRFCWWRMRRSVVTQQLEPCRLRRRRPRTSPVALQHGLCHSAERAPGRLQSRRRREMPA